MPQSKPWSFTSKASLHAELYSLVLMSINRAILGEKKERCMVFSPHSRSSPYKVMNGAPWNQVGFILIGHRPHQVTQWGAGVMLDRETGILCTDTVSLVSIHNQKSLTIYLDVQRLIVQGERVTSPSHSNLRRP